MASNLDFAEVGFLDPRTTSERVQDALWDIPAPDLELLSESTYYTNRARATQGLPPLTTREVHLRLRNNPFD
jgi:hypothetical protein